MIKRQFHHILNPDPRRPGTGMTRSGRDFAAARHTFGRFSETADRHRDDALAALHAHHGRFAKRAFDVVGAIVLLALLSPLLLVIAALVRLGDRGPILFRHTRMGRDGVVFECLKFRTMTIGSTFRLQTILHNDPRAASQWRTTRKLLHDPRITAIGRILRPLGLDELPQLFNVLGGEMSLVGPRPATPEEVHLFGPARKFYLLARPGITGAWQVGRMPGGSIADRIRMESDYLRNSSLLGDLALLAATPAALLARRNR